MTEQRIPKVGEVWRSSWGTEVTILAVDGDWVGHGVSSGGHGWSRLGALCADYRPPSEAWEHPQPTTEWRCVFSDTILGIQAHGNCDAAERDAQIAGYPAVVQCTVTPIHGTLKQVKP